MGITVSVSLDVNPVWYEGRNIINYGVNLLDEKEFDIFNRYFFDRCTLKEIGIVYGVGKTRMHQIVQQIRLKVMSRIGRERDRD